MSQVSQPPTREIADTNVLRSFKCLSDAYVGHEVENLSLHWVDPSPRTGIENSRIDQGMYYTSAMLTSIPVISMDWLCTSTFAAHYRCVWYNTGLVARKRGDSQIPSSIRMYSSAATLSPRYTWRTLSFLTRDSSWPPYTKIPSISRPCSCGKGSGRSMSNSLQSRSQS